MKLLGRENKDNWGLKVIERANSEVAVSSVHGEVSHPQSLEQTNL